jgi:phospho-N-acetylmuramoyl-pentapeptide-transferase
LYFPFVKGLYLPLGPLYVLLVVLVTTGASNAVNLTDGLDGLATGCSLLVGVAFVGVAFLAGHGEASSFLQVPHVEGAQEVAVFSAALVGAGLGFLWFNCHPAQIFMGDTGALALGGALGLTAVLCKQEILLCLVGGVLVAEAGSVILQVLSFKLRRKRIFLIAPLHHHYQFKGWPETKVTVRFWIAGALLALCSLVTLKLR